VVGGPEREGPPVSHLISGAPPVDIGECHVSSCVVLFPQFPYMAKLVTIDVKVALPLQEGPTTHFWASHMSWSLIYIDECGCKGK
jgi:hypothetical protein